MPVSATPRERPARTTTTTARSTAASSVSRTTTRKATASASTSTRTTTTRTASSSKRPVDEVEETTSRLGSLSIKVTDTDTKPTRPTAPSRKPTTAARRPAPSRTATTADQLASELSTRLTLDPSSSKPSVPSAPAPPKVSAASALQSLRQISQTLSDAVQLGWKASAPTKEFTLKSLRASVKNSHDHIAILRESSVTRPVDVERTVIHMCGRLVTLELLEDALDLLTGVRSRLETFYSKSKSDAGSLWFSLQCPRERVVLDESTAAAAGAFLLHSAQVVVRIGSPTDVEELLFTNILTWHDWLSHDLPPQQYSALLTSTFQAVARCTHLEPELLFRLRSWGLRCLLRSSPLKQDPFWDQAGKYSVSYVKSVGKEAWGPVSAFLDELIEEAGRREDHRSLLSGRGFTGICEYRIKFARAMKNTSDVKRIKLLLDRCSESAESEGVTDVQQPDIMAAKLCTALVEPMSIVERLSEESDVDFGPLRLAILSVEDCTRFCSSPGATSVLAEKISADVDRLRLLCTRALAIAGGTTTSASPSGDVSDASISLSTPARAEYSIAVSKLLEAALRHFTTIKGTQWSYLLGCAQSFVTLARSATSKPSGLPSREAFAYLDQAEQTIRTSGQLASATMPGYISMLETLRSLALMHWMFGLALYRGEQVALAVPYLRRACTLGEEIQTHANQDVTDTPAFVAFLEQVPKRWELLGCCEARTGDPKAAQVAYQNGLLASQALIPHLGCAVDASTSFAPLLPNPDFRTLFTLLERYTHVTAFDLLSPRSISIRHVFADLEDGDAEVSGVAALVERQYAYLASSPGARTSEARDAMRSLIADIVIFYDSARFPVRRARALLRQVEQAYLEDEPELALKAAQEIQSLLHFDPASAASSDTVYHVSTIAPLLSSTRDSSLLASCPILVAATSLWSALVSHRVEDGDVCEAVKQQLSLAFAILKANTATPAAVVEIPPEVEEEVTVEKKGSVRTKKVLGESQNRGTKPKKTTKARAPKKTKAASPNVTPKAKAPLEPVSPPVQPAQILDDFASFDALLATSGHLAGMLGLDLLRFESLHLRRMIHGAASSSAPSDGFVQVSSDLAREYVRLGRLDLASALFKDAIEALSSASAAISTETRITVYLDYAAAVAEGGNVDDGLSSYAEAMTLADASAGDPVPAGSSKPLHRVKTMIQSAAAANTFSVIQEYRDDAVTALAGLLQSLRLWNRASFMLERLTVADLKSENKRRAGSPNPFEVQEPAADAPDSASKAKGLFTSLQWVVAQGAADALLNIARLYKDRGSPREAEYFLGQALSLGESVRALGVVDKARMRLAELKYLSGSSEEAEKLLVARGYSTEVSQLDDIDHLRISAGFKTRIGEIDMAYNLYSKASEALSTLETAWVSIQKDSIPSELSETVANFIPSLAAIIWRQQIWLLRESADSDSEYSALLDRFLNLPSSRYTKAEENILMGHLSLNEAHARLKADIVLSALPESTVALPLGMHGGDVAVPPTSTRELQTALHTAEKFYWHFIELHNGRRDVMQSRNAAVSIALIRAYRIALGAKSKNAAVVASSLLDWANANTLRHEMIDCISSKFQEASVDDLAWRTMSLTGSPVRAAPSQSRRAVLRFTDPDSSDEEDDNNESANVSLKTYWRDVAERYRAEMCDAVSLATSQVDTLPENWTVVSVTLTEDKSTLIVTRQRPRMEPVVVYLPINRRDRRDEDAEEDQFTWDIAMDELKEIVAENNETARNSRSVVEREGRVAWWAKRVELDQRLKALVENVEYCWLGVFKTAFEQPVPLTSELRSSFRTKLETVLRRNGCMHEKRRDKQRLHLDDALLDCFSSLSPKCRDEELEDLAYFVLDLFQIHGAQVATSEIDIDQLAIDLRSVLEDHASAVSKARLEPIRDHHMFLVLDNNVQGIPWESIPTLRGSSVSRIPSISFLLDRLHLARHLRGLPAFPSASEAAAGKGVIVDRATVDPRKVFFVLNPSGDLAPTQRRFQAWLEGMKAHVGWSGIVGRVPSEEELIRALTTYDLVIYFGHGGAEQYIRAHKIRNLARCASTMLWGCSSGAMKDMGEFDRIGTPYNYMVAGCPSLVATLWDVTDKDTDTFADAVFHALRLDDERTVRAWSPLSSSLSRAPSHPRLAPRKRTLDGPTDTPVGRIIRAASTEEARLPVSVVSAVNASREVCKLKYLNGAAAVVWGIPFHL